MAQETFSINWLSEQLAIDRRTLKKRLKRATAIVNAQGDFEYRLQEVVAALYIEGAGKLDAEQQRARKDAALAERAEMENAVRRGELAPVSEFEFALTHVITCARSKFLGMHMKIAAQLVNIAEPAIIAEKIRVEIYEALTELSRADPIGEAEANERRRRKSKNSRNHKRQAAQAA